MALTPLDTGQEDCPECYDDPGIYYGGGSDAPMAIPGFLPATGDPVSSGVVLLPDLVANVPAGASTGLLLLLVGGLVLLGLSPSRRATERLGLRGKGVRAW